MAAFKSFSLVLIAKQKNGNGKAILLAERFWNFRLIFQFLRVFYVLAFKEIVASILQRCIGYTFFLGIKKALMYETFILSIWMIYNFA